ncbi:hypothetical protein CRUP_001641, partial [Coryphaenoides rupestris]
MQRSLSLAWGATLGRYRPDECERTGFGCPGMPVNPAMQGFGAMMMPQVAMAMPPDPMGMASQQAVINQQAVLMAQQMTMQAMNLSQQQQAQQLRDKPPSVRPWE